jgi:glycosyltransferase involved in cell wall biosynthesis
MSIARVALISRSFWPDCRSGELAAGAFARSLHAAGIQVQVATSQWANHDASSFEFCEVPVDRIPRTQTGVWANRRFIRHLTQWLTSHAAGWDASLVFGGVEELDAAIRAQQHGGPDQVWMRIDDASIQQMQKFSGIRKKFQVLMAQVDRVLASESSNAVEVARLVSVPKKKIQILPTGIDIHAASIGAFHLTQAEARRAISEIHPMLELAKNDLVGIHVTDFQDEPGLFDLLDAWREVSRRNPQAKLWLTGDGPQARAVWHRIHELSLVNRVLMPGCFDNEVDAFVASDFYVHPELRSGNVDALCRAAACRIPSIVHATDGPDWFVPDEHGLRPVSPDTSSLAESILQMIQLGHARDKLGMSAQTAVGQARGWDRTVSEILSLLESSQPLREDA